MKATTKILFVLLGVLLFSCNNKPSLQQYYVNNQGNDDFVAIDIPTSLFTEMDSLQPQQKKTLETIKKINVLAIPKKTANQEKIKAEETKLTDILKDEKYQLLMKLGGSGNKLEVYYTGNDEAINELIVFGYNENKGMGVARVLGDKMNPSDILNLMKDLQKNGNLNLSGLKGVAQLFASAEEKEMKRNHREHSDSIKVEKDSVMN